MQQSGNGSWTFGFSLLAAGMLHGGLLAYASGWMITPEPEVQQATIVVEIITADQWEAETNDAPRPVPAETDSESAPRVHEAAGIAPAGEAETPTATANDDSGDEPRSTTVASRELPETEPLQPAAAVEASTADEAPAFSSREPSSGTAPAGEETEAQLEPSEADTQRNELEGPTATASELHRADTDPTAATGLQPAPRPFDMAMAVTGSIEENRQDQADSALAPVTPPVLARTDRHSTAASQAVTIADTDAKAPQPRLKKLRSESRAMREKPKSARTASTSEDSKPAEGNSTAKSRQRAKSAAATNGRGAAKVRQGKAQGFAASAVGLGSYKALVRARVYSRLKAPAGIGRKTARVEFGLSASGALRYARLVRSSGSAALDSAALTAVQRAAPFPQPPAGVSAASLSFGLTISAR
jgi:protein TonB